MGSKYYNEYINIMRVIIVGLSVLIFSLSCLLIQAENEKKERLEKYLNYQKVQNQNKIFNLIELEVQNAKFLLTKGFDYKDITEEIYQLKRWEEFAVKGIVGKKFRVLTDRNLSSASILLDEILSRTEKVFTFYDKQKAKFDEARKTLSYVKNNKDFIGTLMTSDSYNNLLAIAESSEPYGEIRKIDEHINGIKQKENEEIETEKQLVRESATKKKESLLKAFSTNEELIKLTEDKFTKFINDLNSVGDITAFHKSKALSILEQDLRSKFKDSITVKVVDIQNELLSKVKDKADSENISKEISHRFHEIVGQIEGEEKLDNINLYIQTALSEQKQFVSAIEGKAPKKQRVSITKPNVKAKINIETEEEVNAYIGEMEKEMKDLKEKMLNAIKESKIVDVK